MNNTIVKLDANVADTFWLLFNSMMVFFMQCGFAMLEVGSVHNKNTKNILTKNLLDACFGSLIWWSVGHSLAYDGDNKFIGIPNKGSSSYLTNNYTTEEDNSGYIWALWFFQYVFAATAATIVSGSVAERAALSAYMIYTVFIIMIIYPVVVHWVWSSSGWLSAFNPDGAFKGGVIDFAGSGVVHMTGGIAGLCGSYIVGPRINRFDTNMIPVNFPGQSPVFQILGVFILWFGWYGFNSGSTLGISGFNYARDAARITVTTTLSATTGGLTTFFVDKFLGSKVWNPIYLSNGILAGLVSITAGCSVVQPWAALIIGATGGLIYFGSSTIVLYKLKIDDPLDAFSVHGSCGIWGVIAASLFCDPKYSYAKGGGLFYGDTNLIVTSLVFILCNIAWTGGLSILLFKTLKQLRILRISNEHELQGLDISKHGSFSSITNTTISS